MRHPTTAGLVALTLSSSTFAKPIFKLPPGQYNGTMIYDFSQLTPSPDLAWTPCFDNFTCTILEVPLDYADPSVGTTGIAFIKWSTNATDSSSPQDILINPGGPGASGVQVVRLGLSSLQAGLGIQNNIIGMDPRGVGDSGPDLSCFPGKDVNGTAALYDPQFGSTVDLDDMAGIRDTFALAGAFGDWCTAVHSAENSTAKYANTVATATDMLHYAELLAESKGENKDDAKLWYHGGSYGTLLGSTFAALFPDRVGRMILDAVADAEDYYQGKWESNLFDADEAISWFFQFCFEAGVDKCALWDESPEAIEARFNAVLEDLEENPIAVTDPAFVCRPTIVTLNDFKKYLLNKPYTPNRAYPELAVVMADLEQRNASLLAFDSSDGSIISQSCTGQVEVSQDIEARAFIACTDANGRFNLSTIDKFVDHVEKLYEQSVYLGEQWASGGQVNCRNLNIRAPDSQVFEGVPSADETSTPILWVSATLDPVTPLRSAKKMRARFPGSGLLIQDNVGHGSFATPSKCTYGYTKQYIIDGTLPPEDTVCESDAMPFQSAPGSTDELTVSRMHKRYFI